MEPYENKDFYIVNAVNTLDAADREKSTIRYIYKGHEGDIVTMVYKESPWHGHLIAFESSVKRMIFHPKLAKVLYPSKQFQFLNSKEHSYWLGTHLPNGYNYDRWFKWMNVKDKMIYTSKRLLKAAGFE